MSYIIKMALLLIFISATPATAQSIAITPAPEWRSCAAEGATCASRAGALVRYGAGTTFAYRIVNGAVRCDNATFGDPALNSPKTCAIASPAAAVVPKPSATAAPVPAPSTDPRAKLGINVAPLVFWSGEPTFANQAMTAEWRDPAGSWGYVTGDRLRDGVPVAIEPGHPLTAFLTAPAAAYRGEEAPTRCTWKGAGQIGVTGARRIIAQDTGSITFAWPKAVPDGTVRIDLLSAPVANIDCRLTTDAPDAVFAPQLLDYLKPFGVLRFLDWTSTNGNPASVTWATRGQPRGIAVGGSDGAALEYQIGLANAVGASPWFTIPWNADEDYHLRAAQLVKAEIPANRQVYVELSNEVWNYQFGQTGQAEREGIAAKLSDNRFQAALHRYAQKTSWAMKIWASVFADRPDQLVRVVSTQNDNPWTAEVVLGWGDLVANVDALATAPYFGHGFFDANPTETDVTKLMTTLAGYAKGVVSGPVAQNSAIAKKYGKRFITYEAGQHVVGPDRLPLVTQMQRSPLMEPIYRDFVAGMAGKTDLLTLYAATGSISQYGAWGLREYAGQPIAETPKLRGVLSSPH